MPTRILETEQDRQRLIRLIEAHKMPCTVTIKKGKDRTLEQNKLQRLWLNEASEQLGEYTAEAYRGFYKLTIGVPILIEENEDFAEKYDKIIKPLSYEQKIQCMMEPLDLPITRIMTTKQKSQYLDRMYEDLTSRGVNLTQPKEG